MNGRGSEVVLGPIGSVRERLLRCGRLFGGESIGLGVRR
jgi:hypothetical protein